MSDVPRKGRGTDRMLRYSANRALPVVLDWHLFGFRFRRLKDLSIPIILATFKSNHSLVV